MSAASLPASSPTAQAPSYDYALDLLYRALGLAAAQVYTRDIEVRETAPAVQREGKGHGTKRQQRQRQGSEYKQQPQHQQKQQAPARRARTNTTAVTTTTRRKRQA